MYIQYCIYNTTNNLFFLMTQSSKTPIPVKIKRVSLKKFKKLNEVKVLIVKSIKLTVNIEKHVIYNQYSIFKSQNIIQKIFYLFDLYPP